DCHDIPSSEVRACRGMRAGRLLGRPLRVGVRREAATSEDVKSMDVSAAGSGEGDAWTFGAEPADFRADSGRDLSARRRTPLEGRTFEGVLLVDGARVANERLSSISPGEIV